MEFEKKIKELQDITKALENPDIMMDEGVELYEKGVITEDEYNDKKERLLSK